MQEPMQELEQVNATAVYADAEVSCAAASAGKGSRFSLHTSMLCSKYAPCA
jgi:hypothetical protein